MKLFKRLKEDWSWVINSIVYWRPHKEVKYLVQRLLYGFSEKDTWSLDMPMAKMIVKALKAFDRWGFKEKYGYPVWLYTQMPESLNIMHLPDDKISEEDEIHQLVWFAIIHRLIDGFERIATGNFSCAGYEPYEVDTLALFEQVYPSLWT